MHSLVKAAIDLRGFRCNLDDDLVDRLNRRYTPVIFVLFAILVSGRQFFGESMHCWCPEVRPSKSPTILCRTVIVASMTLAE